MATVKVKATRDDRRVAFYEQDKAHPTGQALVAGDGGEVEVAETPALKAALRAGRVELVQTPTTRKQTPATNTQGGEKTPLPVNNPPFEGYDDLKAEEVIARLETLDDAGRASVLAELINTPATTTELAHHLHLTAGAVSQHLSLLQRAGLVNPQRSGKRVYYQLSPKGSDLLRLFR